MVLLLFIQYDKRVINTFVFPWYGIEDTNLKRKKVYVYIYIYILFPGLTLSFSVSQVFWKLCSSGGTEKTNLVAFNYIHRIALYFFCDRRSETKNPCSFLCYVAFSLSCSFFQLNCQAIMPLAQSLGKNADACEHSNTDWFRQNKSQFYQEKRKSQQKFTLLRFSLKVKKIKYSFPYCSEQLICAVFLSMVSYLTVSEVIRIFI